MFNVFRARALITCNSTGDVIEDAFLVVEKDRIKEVGPWKKAPRHPASRRTDYTRHILLPGLFNLHTHLPMTLLRGIAEDLPLEDWLKKIIFPLESEFMCPEFVRTGGALGLLESMLGGVTYVGDMYFYMEEMARLVEKAGTRACLGQNVWDLPPPDAKSSGEMWGRVERLRKKFEFSPFVQIAIAPHAPYTCRDATLKAAADYASTHSIPLMIHLAETERERNESLKEHGVTSIGRIEKLGVLNAKHVLAAHVVWPTSNDLQILGRPNVTAVLNPQCNAKLASGIPPIGAMKKAGLRFALGTDGPASNNSLDIFSEMNFLAKIHHVTEGDLTGLSTQEILNAATIRAAEAVGRGTDLGSLEAGKYADFVCVNAERPHLCPLSDPRAHLVFSARAQDVSSVYVAGRPVVHRGQSVHLKEGPILAAAEKIFKRIKRRQKSMH